MREVYWKEKDILINTEKVNKRLLKEYNTSSYSEFLKKIHTLHHKEKNQTFLCPECKKAVYTIVEHKKGCFHFRQTKNNHKYNCRVYPYFTLSSRSLIADSWEFDVNKNNEKEVIIDIVSDNYNSNRLKRDFNFFHYLFNFYVSNVYRFAHEKSVLDMYKLIQINFKDEVILFKDFFIDADKAFTYFKRYKDVIKSKDFKKVKFNSKFIYGEIVSLYDNSYGGMRALLDSKYKKLYLNLTKAQVKYLSNIHGDLRPGNKIMFLGYPNSLSDNSMYFKIFNSKYVSVVKHYLTYSGFYVDSFYKLVISNYFTLNKIDFKIPIYTSKQNWEYSISDCIDKFKKEGNFFIPEWIVFIEKHSKPIMLFFTTKNNAQKTSESIKYFEELGKFKCYEIKKKEIEEKSDGTTTSTIKAINHKLNQIFKS